MTRFTAIVALVDRFAVCIRRGDCTNRSNSGASRTKDDWRAQFGQAGNGAVADCPKLARRDIAG